MIFNHPKTGTVVICDFHGFVIPEMVKRRPVIIVSPRFRKKSGLCTIVPLSVTPPDPIMPYHYELNLGEPLPKPFDSLIAWVKGDMLTTVSFNRLFMPYAGKDSDGKRKYVIKIVEDIDLRRIRECILCAIDLSYLTKHL
jgi:uncharacterized protein YifN (PemK superfamily)